MPRRSKYRRLNANSVNTLFAGLAVAISLYSCNESRLAREQAGPQPFIVEAFSDGLSYYGEQGYDIYLCRSTLQLRNRGGSNTAITNVEVGVTYRTDGGVWDNEALQPHYGATISQPLGVNALVYTPGIPESAGAFGFELMAVGTDPSTIDTFIKDIKVSLEAFRPDATLDRTFEGTNGYMAERSFHAALLMEFLRASSYESSDLVPDALNTLPFEIAAGESRAFPLYLLLVMLDPDNLGEQPSFTANYNIVFDNGFTDRYSTSCQDSNRLPAF